MINTVCAVTTVNQDFKIFIVIEQLTVQQN